MHGEWLRVALDLVGDGVVTTDQQGNITFANPAATSLLDRDQLASLLGRSVRDVDSPFLIKGREGDELHVLIDTAPIIGPSKELAGHVLVIRDVSERVRLRDQLAENDRLTSLGKMAAGIAHEINNPLAFTITNIEFTGGELRHLASELERFSARMGGALGSVAEMNEAMSDARDGTERIKRIVDDLRRFSHRETRANPIDPTRAIELAVRICSMKAKGRAMVRTLLEPTPEVLANEGRLAQILVNLVSNALEAIPEGHAHENEVVVASRVDEHGCVEISVRDSGQGMSEQTRARIFEPFFTTKPPGSRTGLGLSIVRRLLSEIGGEIQVESRAGEGTKVLLSFPAFRASSPAPSKAHRARILLVDDEQLILLAMRRMLGRDHDVIDTLNPLEALERIRSGERFDVILCDLIMPDLAGWELFDELLRTAPDQAEACIFVTGAALHPGARSFLERVKNRRLEKPFDVDSLQRALREVLEERRRRYVPQLDADQNAKL